MTVKIDKKKCNGCKQLDAPQCEKLCPGDLMALDLKSKKAFIRSEEDCWDCMVCVKACPMLAIETKLPYTLAYYGASLKPKVGKDKITWTLKNIDGTVETFEIKTRF